MVQLGSLMPSVEYALCTSLASAEALVLLSLIQPHCSLCYPHVSTSPSGASSNAILPNLPMAGSFLFVRAQCKCHFLRHAFLATLSTVSYLPQPPSFFPIPSPRFVFFFIASSLLERFHLLLFLSTACFILHEYKVLKNQDSVVLICC